MNEKQISELISVTAREVVKECKYQKLIRIDKDPFRKVELLLINYNNLKAAVQQKQEDIEYIEENGPPESSKSIVIYSTGGGNTSVQERYSMLIEKYKLEKIETERQLSKIDNALDKVRGDKYFKILEYKYLNEEKLTDEEIAEALDMVQSTVTRNKVKLINKLKVILFPESLQDL